MSTQAQASADLLLKLYELRRESTLREARDWFAFRFAPKSAQDVLKTWLSEESGPYRMVTTYWEMAASFVTAGAIDEKMFHAANTEYVAVYLKLEPHLAELRTMVKLPDYLENLEKVVAGTPNRDARLGAMRRYLEHRQRGERTAPGFGKN